MKKLFSILFFITFISWKFVVPAPQSPNHIVDLDNKLTSEEVTYLNKDIESITNKFHIQMGVLITPSRDGNFIEFVRTVYSSWNLGRELDNGILIVLDVDGKVSGMHTGKWIETYLSDEECIQIMTEQLNPEIMNNDYYSGLNQLINKIDSKISYSYSIKHPQYKEYNNYEYLVYLLIALSVIVIVTKLIKWLSRC